ncbi:YbaK/EbsC family protein [Actinotalea ferrariae]|uniref:aminoacyl-tRNA deacylase n=1 Tax=Actinotalea ferrariae TaxID=1386098 RepID=UPI001C8C22D2|nr:YbaK/EbsC family protein [Actinotalea ferrariae]MBX9246195.1 YbaK/EbsC family protein [Actinotalea ferrariae]
MTDATTPPSEGEQRAVAALEAAGLRYRLTRHGPVRSLAEAARARRLPPDQIVKTLVVRRGDDDFLFVLVPGGRTIAWPRLRELLGVSRLSMPDAAVAKEVTGYERGTITPFGATRAWPVIADARVAGRPMSIGAGAHGVAATVDGSRMVLALGATVADVTDPEPGTEGADERPAEAPA